MRSGILDHIYLSILCVCIHAEAWRHWWSWLSPSSASFPEIELMLSGLAANTFASWAIFPALRVRAIIATSSLIKPGQEILDLLEAIQLAKQVAAFITRATRRTWSKKIGWQTKRQKRQSYRSPESYHCPSNEGLYKSTLCSWERQWALKQGANQRGSWLCIKN